MGTTASGLRYPEPTEPVANGATAIRNLAEDVAATYGVHVDKFPIIAVTLGAGGGTVQIGRDMVVAAAPFNRWCRFAYNAVIGSSATFGTFTARLNGSDVTQVRGQTPQSTVHVEHWEYVNQGTSGVFQAILICGGALAVYGPPLGAGTVTCWPA
jgi:hypothetical protein